MSISQRFSNHLNIWLMYFSSCKIYIYIYIYIRKNDATVNSREFGSRLKLSSVLCAGYCRVLAAVDRGDPVQLFLCVPPPLGQAEAPAPAETERNQPDRLQRRLQLPHLHAGPKYEPSTHYHCSQSDW